MSGASSARRRSPDDTVGAGMTDDEIASHTDRWRAELDTPPIVAPSANAAELLDAVRADEAL